MDFGTSGISRGAGLPSSSRPGPHSISARLEHELVLRRRMAKRLGLLTLAVDRGQELLDRPQLESEGEHFELGATERAEHRIDFEHLADQLSP